MATISGEIHQFKNKAGTKNWWPRTVTEAIYGLDSTIADVKTWVGNNYVKYSHGYYNPTSAVDLNSQYVAENIIQQISWNFDTYSNVANRPTTGGSAASVLVLPNSWGGLQFYTDYNSNTYYIRNRYSNTGWKSWVQLYHTGNFNPANYLTTSAAAGTYLPLAGGTLSGDVTTNANIYLLGTNSFSAIVKKNVVTSGGWARSFLQINNNSDEVLWALGGYGEAQGLTYMYFGSSAWNSDNNIKFYNSGTIKANTFQKNGGTSSQFLKADGSVDSNTYLTTSSAASTYVNKHTYRNHSATETQYTGPTYISAYVGNNAIIERGSWDYANNGYIDSGLGIIPLAGTMVVAVNKNANGTALFITPSTSSTGTAEAGKKNEMFFFTQNGNSSNYPDAWTRVVTNRNFADVIGTATYVTLANVQTITGAKYFGNNAFVLAGAEEGDTMNQRWDNSTYYNFGDTALVSSLSGLRNAIRFHWYDNYYDVGVVRGGGKDDIGFAIGKENADHSHVLDYFRVSSTDAYVHGYKVYHVGNLTPSNYLSREGGSMFNKMVVTDLNADLLDGKHYADILLHGGWCGGSVRKWGKIMEFSFSAATTVDTTATILFSAYNTTSNAMIALMTIDVRGNSPSNISNCKASWSVRTYDFSSIVKVTRVYENSTFYIRVYAYGNAWGDSVNVRLLHSHNWSGDTSSYWKTYSATYEGGEVATFDSIPTSETEVAIGGKSLIVGASGIIYNINTTSDWTNPRNTGLRILNTVGTSVTGAPSNYSVALSVSGYYGFQLACTGANNNFYIRSTSDGTASDHKAWVQLWHSANSNLSTVPWACSTLTASGNITGYGSINIGGQSETSTEYRYLYLWKHNSDGQALRGLITETDSGLELSHWNKTTAIGYTTLTIGAGVVTTSGNVGIGITSPSSPLHVNGDITTSGKVIVGTGGSSGSAVGSSATTDIYLANSAGYALVADGLVVRRGAAATNGQLGNATYRWANIYSVAGDFSGKVTVSGSWTNGSAGVTINNNTTSAIPWLLDALAPNMSTGTYTAIVHGKANSAYNAASLSFYNAGAGSANNYAGIGLYGHDNLLIVRGDGNVGIGTQSPSAKLQIASTTYSYINTRLTGSTINFDKLSTNATGFHNAIIFRRLDASLNVVEQVHLIGTYSSDKYVCTYIAGTANTNSAIRINGSGTSATVSVGYTGGGSYKFNVNGVIYSTTGIFSDGYVSALGTASSSDAKLKDDINTISYDRAKEVLSALNPREWTWNSLTSKEGERGAGMVAQEVKSILPDTVKEIGGNLTLEYNTLFAYGLAMTKYMLPMVETHEEKIARLEKEVEELKRQLTN